MAPILTAPLHVTSPHTKGDHVLRAQKALAKWGAPVGALDGDYGVQTAAAARQMRYRFGYPLAACVGVVDDRLLAILEGRAKLTLAERATAAARRLRNRNGNRDAAFRARLVRIEQAEDGVKESPPGSNDGPRVRDYQRTTGAYRAAWCASFQWWALRAAGYKGAGPTYPAYCPSWEAKAKAGTDGWQIIPKAQMVVGDHVLYDFGDGEAQHIGLCVVKPDGSGRFEAWEGNTSTSSDDNGGAVMKRTRYLSSVRCVVRVPAP